MVALLVQSALLALLAFTLGAWFGYALRQVALFGASPSLQTGAVPLRLRPEPELRRTSSRQGGIRAAPQRDRSVDDEPGPGDMAGDAAVSEPVTNTNLPVEIESDSRPVIEQSVRALNDSNDADDPITGPPPAERSAPSHEDPIEPQNIPSATVAADPDPAEVFETAIETPPEEVFDEDQPIGLETPRSGIADDLQRIRGIGAKTQDALNTIGIWHYDQIGAWTEAEMAWVAEYLGFPGRVAREGWIGQAGILAAGVDTEYSRAYDRRNEPKSVAAHPPPDPADGSDDVSER